MSIVQTVQNGKLVDTSASSNSSSSSSSTSGSNLDKEDFLKLLVAQMQYQDPLEPQSNTEYVTQLATFTQVESTENMATTMEQTEANNLVGQSVIMKVTSSTTGETSYVSGTVDYVTKEGSNVYLSINDKLYDLDDLDTVASTDYMNASTLANTFKNLVAALPAASQITTSNKEQIAAVRKVYDDMTDYQKTFVSSDDLTTLSDAEKKLAALEALANAAGGTTTTTTDSSTTGSSTTTDTSTGTDS